MAEKVVGLHTILSDCPGETPLPFAYEKRQGGIPVVESIPAKGGCGLIWEVPIVRMAARRGVK